MPETLSQEQIDAMLNNAFSGGTLDIPDDPKNEVKEYDFRSPKKFTKERMKILDSIFENYARLLSSYFTGLLRLYCKVTLASIEEQRYFEWNNALPDYVMMGMTEMQLDNDEIEDLTTIIQLSNSITFIVIDRLLGGKGEYKDSDRDFTEIEVSIMDSIFKSMVAMLREPWEGYMEVRPVLQGIETNSRVISTVGYDDTMIIVVLEIVISETKTLVTVSMPALALDEVMQRFANKSSRSPRKFDPARENERKGDLLKNITHTDLDVTAILGQVDIDMQEVINLQVNDIIPLNKNTTSNVAINVGGEKWFDGKMGTANNKKAVKIETIYHNI
ncbi:MAG: flagellar motor switch protein FliM [Oscillospiraceae bacterium]|nr:flagellar motor switch protein FliM [Oscillospiraceae bacterium]